MSRHHRMEWLLYHWPALDYVSERFLCITFPWAVFGRNWCLLLLLICQLEFPPQFIFQAASIPGKHCSDVCILQMCAQTGIWILDTELQTWGRAHFFNWYGSWLFPVYSLLWTHSGNPLGISDNGKFTEYPEEIQVQIWKTFPFYFNGYKIHTPPQILTANFDFWFPTLPYLKGTAIH